jgi:hypothetical protein
VRSAAACARHDGKRAGGRGMASGR